MKTLLSLIPTFLCICILTGCASIMNGTKQSLGISSIPSGANVTVDGKSEGTSPVLVQLSRKKSHLIKIEMAGFEPFELYTKRKYSGWVWGNILLGGIIGIAVDTATGAIYKITPTKVNGSLIQKQAQGFSTDDLVFEAVLTPDPTWEKIGSMTKTL